MKQENPQHGVKHPSFQHSRHIEDMNVRIADAMASQARRGRLPAARPLMFSTRRLCIEEFNQLLGQAVMRHNVAALHRFTRGEPDDSGA